MKTHDGEQTDNNIKKDKHIYFSSVSKACLPGHANLKTNDYSKQTFIEWQKITKLNLIAMANLLSTPKISLQETTHI